MWCPGEISFALILCGLGIAKGNQFPPDFLFGAATAAYQVEGARNESDKGESIWDRFTHSNPDKILDHSNGDIACDSYHKYKEDIQLLKSIGAKAYRFSLSWPRILPDGFPHRISQDGVRYYNNLINECIKNDIIPMVTIYHWDLPQRLQDLGGWANPLIVRSLYDFADVVFALFGDRVKHWITINEPTSICVLGYGDHLLAPALQQPGIADYLCIHHVLLAHANINALYKRKYKKTQNGSVGIVLNLTWFVPSNHSSITDTEAAVRAFEFYNDWLLHPLLAHGGDYPQLMKDIILKKSLEQGFENSRLPVFSAGEIALVKNSLDFLGVNFYSALSVKDWHDGKLSLHDDRGYKSVYEKHWKGVHWTKDTPLAFDKLLETLHKKYRPPVIYITENGYGDEGKIFDADRVEYIHDNLHAVLRAIRNGVNVGGYIHWSLMDNYEWYFGYTNRFGLFSVDFNRPERPRTPKLSATYVAEIYGTKTLPHGTKFIEEARLQRNNYPGKF